MDICFICLKNEINLTNVEAVLSDTENVVLHKLRNFLPELVSCIDSAYNQKSFYILFQILLF